MVPTPFTHLHVHTQYSTLDGASQIPALVDKAIADGMTAVAITDHGNMFGVKEFFNYISKKNGGINGEIKSLKAEIKKLAESDNNDAEKKTAVLNAQIGELQKKLFKPIIGCEVYVSPTSRFDKNGKEDRSGNHLILLAKNKTGYHNLVKLVSLGYIEGFYYKPRIDKALLEQYSEGLIVSSACIAGEIPRHIMNGDISSAETSILWFKERFGDDFYLELQRHKTFQPDAATDVYPRQQEVNPVLAELGQKHGVKCVVTNDVHFVNENEAEAHDRLLCISTGTDVNEANRLRYTKQEWFKTRTEMEAIFPDHREALENTCEIAEKVEFYDINSAPIMPDFPLPEGFETANDYLRHLTYKGAENRYDNLDESVRERIDFELETIKNMGYPGYFLIVQDFIAAARNMGVSVGPGRGSAAGSVVAYCLRITDIDPIKYDLLFERFLNPDRISMPDIDIDFDDDGRGQVLQWVTEKYGRERVAHIVTFGTMAAKSAIKDVARVQNVPLSEADRLSKLIDAIPRDEKVNITNAIKHVPAMKEAYNSSDPLIANTIKYAQMLEGTVRQTGVHACGVVIGRDDLTNYVPISTAFDKETNTDILVTQYEGSLIEDVGMMKMDFLGLKTLSIIKEALINIKLQRDVDLDINTIPLDDAPTYELYSKGETTGTFQFESEGMKKHLRDLRPTKFDDLIAMNALYRPGPMDYIPDFIARKHGRKPIVYDIPVMEQRLKDTYGITVYQEQVMLLSRDLAGFTRGQSDELRKAMGKKLIEKMNALKEIFVSGCKANGHNEKVINKIWDDWVSFASYAFNKSHATCYSWVAYQTAYLKANYPSEYMAAVLSRNISNLSEITKFMEECRRMKMEVLGPDVNESLAKFTVNKKGSLRFGMAAIKGVGENVVDEIVSERNKNGTYTDIYNFVERLNLQTVNKKALEALAIAGAFDGLGNIHRAQYFAPHPTEDGTFIERLLKYGSKYQIDRASQQNSLFGAMSMEVEIKKPEIPECFPFTSIEKLEKEREVIGIYLSAHPLDEFRLELKHYCNLQLSALANLNTIKGRDFTVGGMVTNIKRGVTRERNNPYGILTLEDYSGSHEFALFGQDFLQFANYLEMGLFLLIKGKVQGRKFDPNTLETKIMNISPLNEVVEKHVRNLTLKIPLQELTEDMVTELVDVSFENKGNVIMHFHIIDSDNQQVKLLSRSVKVNLTPELVNFFDIHPEITLSLS
ncbi:MAG: DNA polymerase III subunit alpha [Cytophagaceae bacterium]|jgi:DNA polymerase-3 subunit alpha|nr:DNA polymerase III subunit alpha [Cytophagaceae bacterium]